MFYLITTQTHWFFTYVTLLFILPDQPIDISIHYCDDTVILSLTSIGLKRALRSLMDYCTEEELITNYSKTKILTFSKCPKQKSWKLEWVKIFKYLGVVFQAPGSRNAHLEYVSHNAQTSASAIQTYYFARGAQFIPAAITLFVAKARAQLLYGA